MSKVVCLRILVLIAVSVALAGTPESASAQRAGHGGGGSFHGGGGGFHSGGGFGGFRGGGGGFRGGGFGGFHGRGFGGFHGRPFFGGFGFPRYGYGLSFGFGAYWGYPYFYGYAPWWNPYAYYSPYDPYYYTDAPDYLRDNCYRRDNCSPRDNRDGCDYRHEDAHPDACKPNNERAPAKPSSTPVPESSPERNYVTTTLAGDNSAVSLADYRSAASNDPSEATTAVASNYQLSDSMNQPLPSGLRPAMRNVIQALRAMPPDAQQRQLKSGRYHRLSPEEREFLTNAIRAR